MIQNTDWPPHVTVEELLNWLKYGQIQGLNSKPFELSNIQQTQCMHDTVCYTGQSQFMLVFYKERRYCKAIAVGHYSVRPTATECRDTVLLPASGHQHWRPGCATTRRNGELRVCVRAVYKPLARK